VSSSLSSQNLSSRPSGSAVTFAKLQATGNDFIVVDDAGVDGPQLTVTTRRWLCDRHLGVGADGVLTVLPARPEAQACGAVYRMHITNPDGSVPEMCGNGLRCVALYLATTGRIDVDAVVVVDTDAGPRSLRVAPTLDAVAIDMGPARFVSPAQFPVPLHRAAYASGDVAFARATTVSMGNPHLVVEVDALPSAAEAARLGFAIEHDHTAFPERTNIEWAVVRADGTVDVVVWERGAGLTQACGTGACGVAATLVRYGVLSRGTTTVRLPGGPLEITVGAPEDSVWMRGPVRHVFEGVAHPAIATDCDRGNIEMRFSGD
jgi:diaminopimelate epimerase